LFLPVAAVLAAIGLSIWGSGMLERAKSPRTAATATTSRGLVFGLCNEGGLTNCVASGDSFYLGGKTVRVAGIEAPQLYGAACPKEATLGRKSAAKLQGLLNSGELEMMKVGQDLDRYGLLLRNVAVDGKDVGRTMVAAGLARDIGDLTRSWC
jgi:endonuclease YncB( thermonuclease family)